MTDSQARPQLPCEAPLVGSTHAPDFQAVYRAEFSYVWKTLRRLGAPPRDLDDLTHDLFVVVYRRLSDYDATRPLRPWLFGIAVRVMSDYRRSARRIREPLETHAEPPPEAPIAEEATVAAEARSLLIQALDSLDLDRRAVFVMHELDELPIPEVAVSLGIPVNTAYSRLRLARAEIAAFVRRFRAKEQALV
jgi:RNA polymerase sigma-70 factor (ECF subfamily)